MKLGQLKSIGHNIADSLASGIGLMIGVYTMDVFREAAATPEKFIEVNFLTGESTGGEPSASLAKAFKLYAQALPDLCEREGVPASAFSVLKAKFFGGPTFPKFTVTVEDGHGRRSEDTYEGSPGRRVKVLDALGRVRRK